MMQICNMIWKAFFKIREPEIQQNQHFSDLQIFRHLCKLGSNADSVSKDCFLQCNSRSFQIPHLNQMRSNMVYFFLVFSTCRKATRKLVQANWCRNSLALEEVPFCTICEALRLPCHNISWWWWCQKPSRMSSRPWKRERSRLKQASPIQTSSWAGNCPHFLCQTKALASGQCGHPFSQDFIFPDFALVKVGS